jgi:hypothetical protein
LWVELSFPCRSGLIVRRRCLLDTGAPISVVPEFHQRVLDIDWQPLPGGWPVEFLTWLGAPCVVGRVDAWIQIGAPPFLHGPLNLLAKFPQATPPNRPGTLPVLLGLNFLAEHRAEVSFQCHTPPQAGAITLP